jgi:colanic acid/amylovoran/stewartan biosynthesis glycosyltransferase WcaL/AmsK/CpsK
MLQQNSSRWTLPSDRWVLHSTPLLGNLTSRWIDVQVSAANRFDFRLLGLEIAEGAERLPYWLLAGDRLDWWLAYKGMFKSGGFSPIWLAGQFRPRPPAVVHIHYGPPAAQLTRFAKALDRPMVVSFYGYDATKADYTERRLWRRRYGRLFETAGAFLAEGPAMGARLAQLGCPEHKIHVVRLPVDERALSGCERREGSDFLVVLAAALREKKGFDTGIEAFARALKGRPDARLLVIGDGPLAATYRSIAAAAGIEDQITWVGFLRFDELMARLSSASVVLYPSRRAADGDSEGGAPVTLIEAQWIGVPSIVSDHDDLPFVAAPDGSVVVPPTRVDQWADAIRDLYEHRDRTSGMGVEASTFVRKHHSSAANADARETIYESLGGGHT